MTASSLWPVPPPEHPSLENDEVHVWRVCLNQHETNVESFLKLFSADELYKANRFHFLKDRNSFIITRGILRIILGRYLNLKPYQLCFGYNSYGKPFLADNALTRLRFNLSHSHELALYAFSLHRDIGIDIEYVRDDIACEEIANQFFSEQEVATLYGLPERQRIQAFFNCWTRKEAYVKGRGEGLSFPLNRFDVSLGPNDALLHIKDRTEEFSKWSLRELTPEVGYAAAIAIEGENWNLKCWQWEE